MFHGFLLDSDNTCKRRWLRDLRPCFFARGRPHAGLTESLFRRKGRSSRWHRQTRWLRPIFLRSELSQEGPFAVAGQSAVWPHRRISGALPLKPRHFALQANSMIGPRDCHGDDGEKESRVFAQPNSPAPAAGTACPAFHAAGSKRKMPGVWGQRPQGTVQARFRPLRPLIMNNDDTAPKARPLGPPGGRAVSPRG